MKPRKPSIAPNLVVWRISESDPKGEWVQKAAPAQRPLKRDLPEVTDGSWVSSSFDLLNGSEIVEVSDTLPDELFDQLFTPPQTETPKGSDE